MPVRPNERHLIVLPTEMPLRNVFSREKNGARLLKLIYRERYSVAPVINVSPSPLPDYTDVLQLCSIYFSVRHKGLQEEELKYLRWKTATADT